MQPAELEQYLHEHIPLSDAMGTHVVEADADRVILTAPLAPNLNHRDTVFGGSASALAILAAWSLVHVRLKGVGAQPRIVIQRNKVDYLAPIPGDFSATAYLADPQAWPRFLGMLEKRGRARISVNATIGADDIVAGRFEGDFVAIDLRFGNSPDGV